MKRSGLVILLVVALFALLGCSASSPIATPLRLTGTGTNTTANKSSGVTLTITTGDNVTFHAVGSFDAINLFGRFDTSGTEVSCEDAQNKHTCFHFSGELLLGDDGSGFPSGTRTTYEMDLSIDENNNATGSYVIGKIPQHMDYEQFGVLELSAD